MVGKVPSGRAGRIAEEDKTQKGEQSFSQTPCLRITRELLVRGTQAAIRSSCYASYEVLGFNAAPFGVKVFGDEPPVAVMRQMFAAKQTTVVEQIRSDCLFHLPPGQQIQKLFFVNFPIAFAFFIRTEDVLSGSEFGQVNIPDASDFPEEVGQIFLFREAGQLRVVVQADVHDAPDPGVFQAREEFTRGFLGEAYGEKFNFHDAAVLPAGRVRLPGRLPFRPAICKPRQ